MATDKEASCPTCSSDPNFAVICSFLNKFAEPCGITFPSFAELQDMLEDTQEVSQVLIDMHVKLLRKARKSFTADKWERALAKFCHTYSQQDGWELERFGYKKARLGVKVKLLKVLLETQFDVNAKFKTEVNKCTPTDLRLEPLGRDQTGLTYWCQFDPASHVRVYREDVDDETWELIAKDRDGLVQLIDSLSNGEGQRELNNILNEDSTSQEIEKPITDTGQNPEADEDEGKDDDKQKDDDDDEDEDGSKDDGEEEASDEEIEEDEEEDEIEDAKDSRDTDEPKSDERIPSDDSKSKSTDDVPPAKLPDSVLKTNVENGAPPSSENSENSFSGVDLSLKSEPKKFFSPSQQGNFYMIPDRHPLPETADILSQMSAKFNENKEVEDLSANPKKTKAEESEETEIINPPKKVKFIDEVTSSQDFKAEESKQPISLPHLKPEAMNVQPTNLRHYNPENYDQPVMLVKKNIKEPEEFDEPISLVTGNSGGSREDDDSSLESDISDAIEEPVQHVVGPGSGAECNAGNTRHCSSSVSQKADDDVENKTEITQDIEVSTQNISQQGSDCCYDVQNSVADCLDFREPSQINEPEFSDVIEEPVQYIVGLGSGAECNIGNPQRSEPAESNTIPSTVEHEFSSTIEEPVRYIKGTGSGAECGVGSPRRVKDPSLSSSSYSIATMGIECTMSNLTLGTFEPKFSDVIEEPVILIQGSGYGHDCLTGNPDEKEETSVEENAQEKKLKIFTKNIDGVLRKDGSGAGSLENIQNSVESLESSKKINNLTEAESSDHSAKLDNISTKDNVHNCEKIETEPANSKNLLSTKIIEQNSFLKENTSDRSVDLFLPVKNNIDNKANSPSNDISSNCLQYNNISSHKGDVSEPLADKGNKTSMSENNDSSLISSAEDVCLHNNIQKMDDNISEPIQNSKSNEIGMLDLSKKAENAVLKNDDESDGDEGNTSVRGQTSKTKMRRESSTTKSITKNENGPLSPELENCTAEKLSAIDSSKDTDKSNEKDGINNSNINDVNPDKKIAPRKNVMLTNIIEICLDNNSNSKENSQIEKQEPTKAKYNDLFSAKDLVNPPSKKGEKKKKISEDEDKSVSSSKENIRNDPKKDEESANFIKEDFEETVKSEGDKEKVEPAELKQENSKPIENIEVEDKLTKSSDSDSDVKIKNESDIKNESEIKNEPEIKNESYIKNEEEDLKNAEKLSKQVPRGRKSRTNSLCNEKEVEIPNKIRKTDKVEAKPTRRSMRKGNRSNSQSGLNSVSEDENKKQENIEEKSSSDHNDLVKDPRNSDEPKNSEEKDEEQEKKENSSEKSSLNLSNFLLEAVAKDEASNKNPSRKRRSSMRLSRSEEEGAEPQEEEEEAGGKKPRLRGKARRGRGRGTAVASRPPPEASSSEDENKAEKKEDAQKKVVPVSKQDHPKSRVRPTTRAAGKTKANIPPSAPPAGKNKKKGKSKQDVKAEESVKEVKKQTPTKKSAKASRKAANEAKKREQSEERKDNSDSENDNKNVKAAQGKKKAKKSSSKIPVKQRKTSKDEKQSSDEEEEEEEEEDDEEEEEDEETDDENLKDKLKKEVKSKEKKKKVSSSQEHLDKNNDDEPDTQEEEKPKPKKVRTPKKKTLLGLMESDLIHSKPSNTDEEDGGRVRQSRRIAQIKIKEEAERRAIEEATMLSIKDMKKAKKEEKQPTSKKSKKKKGRSEMGSEDEDETFKNPVPEDKKLGRKKKKRKDRLKYDENRPWRSSSDSSSEEADEEEEHFEEEDDEEDIRAKQLVSDHEFSPESDLEGEGEEESALPVRRARTAKKEPVVADADAAEEAEEEETEDYPCKKCGQPNHPEWILLCDKCDSGYHASCLRPPLMLIPEGDWFCPPCQHADLVNKLKETLRIFEKSTKKRENEELRRKRLAYVGISLANVLPTTEKSNRRKISSSEYSSSEEETESSEDDEPVYQLRQRRTALQTNYRFNDYDELINSAIQDEMELVKGAGNMGRGKDIANIVDAEKEKEPETAEPGESKENGPDVEGEEEEEGENWRPRVVPKITALPSLRKKPKKLTDLDRASDDDGDSDEDFKGSSEEEEYSSTEGDSDDSEAKVPIRRSSRNRVSRIDKEFINDDSESSDEPRRKKTRRLYASSSSESSDSTWGRRKRKAKTFNRIRFSKSGKKKKKSYFDSDSDRPKKVKTKRPKIKYGLSEDDEDDGGPIRRTRGKKVSYLDVAGSDTEEEVIRRSRKLPSDDEDEFIPEKEGGDEEEAEPEEDEDAKGNNENDEDTEKENDDKEESSSGDEVVDKNLNDSNTNKNLKGPAVVAEPVKRVEAEKQKVSEGEDIDEEDDVEEEEIEEEIEEEVEEEEYEGESDEKVDEAKNLAIPKLRIVDTRELIRREPEVVRKVPPVTITVVKANPSAGAKDLGTHAPPAVPLPPSVPLSVPVPVPAAAPPTAVPTPVIKVEVKKEEKEEKKEPVPAIRLVPSAKLLDPNKQRRVADESVIRGMLSAGGYYRPQRIPQAPPPQYRQRYQEQQRYSMYQPPPPPPPHQYYPTGGYYANEEYGGYDEHMEQQVGGGGDEDGVFSGLVSYFSSQREDNLDS